MRCTAASSLVVAGVLLAAVSLMPVVPEASGGSPVATQEAAKPEASAGSKPGEESVEQQAVAALDRKLSQAETVDFKNIPLREAIGQLADQIEVDVIFDEQEIEEEGLSVDNQVSLKLEHTPVTARAALEFMLEPQGLAFANHSGVLFITTQSGATVLLTIKIYDVRDLVEHAASNYTTLERRGGPNPTTGGDGFFSVQDQVATSAIAAQLAQGGGMGMGMGTSGVVPLWSRSPEQQAIMALVQLIQQTTGGPWFSMDGTGGSMMPFDGLIVIRQSERTHHQVQKLLDGLREANESELDSSVTTPKGDVPDKGQRKSEAGLPDVG